MGMFSKLSGVPKLPALFSRKSKPDGTAVSGRSHSVPIKLWGRSKYPAKVSAKNGVSPDPASRPWVPDAFLCPILCDVMQDPVTLGNTGHTFERRAIEKWLAEHDTDPLTNLPLNGDVRLLPNRALQSVIQEFAATNRLTGAPAAGPAITTGQQRDMDGVTSHESLAPPMYRAPYKQMLPATPLPDLNRFLQAQLNVLAAHSDRSQKSHLVLVESGSQEHAVVRRAMATFFGTDRLLCIKDVQRVENNTLAQKFQTCPMVGKHSTVAFKVHGTKASAAASIVKDGFRLPIETDDDGRFLAGVAARDAHNFEYLKFGGGIYFTSHGTKADAFGGEDSVMLVCAVRLGNTWQRTDEDPTLTSDKVRAAGYDSIYSPGSAKGGVEGLDEFAVYNPHAVYPMYAVRYRTVRVRTAQFFLAQMREGVVPSTGNDVQGDGDHHIALGKIRQAAAGKHMGSDVVDELACLGNMCRLLPASAVVLEDATALHALLWGLTITCEVTQWQTLRVLANFMYRQGRRQALMHQRTIAQKLFPYLQELLGSANEAVVQKAAFVACNLRANHAPPSDFAHSKGLLRALVRTICSSREEMTVLYAAAALTNLVIDGTTAEAASEALPHVLRHWSLVVQHELWAQWVANLCRNFLQFGQRSTIDLLHREGIGASLSGLIQQREVQKSAEIMTDIVNCTAYAALKSKAIADECSRNQCVPRLVSLLGMHGGSTDFYVAQAIGVMCSQSVYAGISLQQPTILAAVVRHFGSQRCLAGTRAKWATTLLRLDDATLERLGVSRGTLQRAVRDFKGTKLGHASTSLADNI